MDKAKRFMRHPLTRDFSPIHQLNSKKSIKTSHSPKIKVTQDKHKKSSSRGKESVQSNK